MLERPQHDEYAPYYENYMALVAEGDVLERLSTQLNDTVALLQQISEEMGNYRYAPNKWSLKEVFGHIADTERIASYRLLRIARGDTTPLAGFDENLYVAGASFDKRTVKQLIEEFVVVRKATLSLCNSLTDEAWLRRGKANNYDTSARSIAYFIAGHELHHRNIINERYLNK